MAMATVRPLTGTLFVLKVCPLGSGEGPIDVQVELLSETEFRLSAATFPGAEVDPATEVLVLLCDIPAWRFICWIARPRAPGSSGLPGTIPRNLLMCSARCGPPDRHNASRAKQERQSTSSFGRCRRKYSAQTGCGGRKHGENTRADA